jgi:hypothetical protein
MTNLLVGEREPKFLFLTDTCPWRTMIDRYKCSNRGMTYDEISFDQRFYMTLGAARRDPNAR